ncbi:MAG: hypothetical protein HY862_20050 [Chloroflexi bacterium]|nr:hypothetical protein [Chloroflexota bacterium]
MSYLENPKDFADSRIARLVNLNTGLAIIITVVVIGLGMILRGSILNATTPFKDEENGIRGQIPANWLLDANPPSYVFRAENPNARPFKTLIQASLQTVGPDANPRSVVDLLVVQGPNRLPGYDVQSILQTSLGEDEAVEIQYSFIQSDPNPFLQSVPVVVQGIDLVVLRGNQAVILTYRDAVDNFERNRPYFERFLQTVEY